MTALSGQKTVAAAGVAVQLGAQDVAAPLMVKALDTNTGVVAIGNDGAGGVTVSNGLRLSAGDVIIFEYVANMTNLWLDSAVNGEGVSWIILDA